jgi:plasmid maintenance system antidote protein VapI
MTPVQKIAFGRLEALGMGDLWNAQIASRWGETPQSVSAFLKSPEKCHIETAVRFASHLGVSLDELYKPLQEAELARLAEAKGNGENVQEKPKKAAKRAPRKKATTAKRARG